MSIAGFWVDKVGLLALGDHRAGRVYQCADALSPMGSLCIGAENGYADHALRIPVPRDQCFGAWVRSVWPQKMRCPLTVGD